MVFLRNRLASYEVYVADYYLKRGAWVGAINRAKYAIETYDGAPQIKRALEIMAQSYRKLDMADLAADSERVLKENYSNPDPGRARGEEEELVEDLVSASGRVSAQTHTCNYIQKRSVRCTISTCSFERAQPLDPFPHF